MERLEKFNYLMGVIEDWAEETPDRYGSTFRHLQKGAAVRELAATPGCSISVQQLKTFLALEVLGIYRYKSASKVSWLDVRRALAGESDKKYRFVYDELDKCFSAEANRLVAKDTQLIGEKSGLTDQQEGWKDIPLYLLERLQEKFRKNLGEYWKMCDMGSIQGTDEEEKEKQDYYLKCLMALALHELFVKKYSESWNMLTEEAERQDEIFRNLPGEMEEVINSFGRADEEERKKLVERSRDQVRKAEVLQKWYKKFMILGLSCLEHNISLGAEIQIVMLLEKKRLEEIKEDGKVSEYKVGKYLTFMENRFLSSLEAYNRNKKNCYRQLELNIKDIFVDFIDNIPWESRQDITWAVKKYLKIVEQGNIDAVQRRELWRVQSMIACPVMTQTDN